MSGVRSSTPSKLLEPSSSSTSSSAGPSCWAVMSVNGSSWTSPVDSAMAGAGGVGEGTGEGPGGAAAPGGGVDGGGVDAGDLRAVSATPLGLPGY